MTPRKPKNTKKSRLESHIEQSVAPTTDSIDSDLLSHVRHFFSEPIPAMDQFSLETPEQAREALVVIEKTQRFLEQKMRTAKILKALCENS